ncbi:MAG: substrate-binding domain-containing protein [Firmicutes bacterium]|nr:substrate-binding domain-containing protein [Bacillota bacterium]
MKKLVKLGLIALCAVIGLAVFTGCSSSFREERPVAVVSREPDSGSRDSIMEMLFGSTDAPNIIMPEGVIVQNSTAAIYVEVSGNPQAIGYESLGHLSGRTSVRMISVDGVPVTPENVRDGSYPFARNLSVVYHQETLDSNPAAYAFRLFMVSAEAQAVIDYRGYVSQVVDASAYVPVAGLTGTIRISGSTTVHPLMNRLVEEFRRLQPNVTMEVAGGGSGAGRNNMRDGISDFGMTSAPVTDAQRESMAAGRTVRDLTIADDAIAIIVHSTNPMTNITSAQLRHLYNRDSGTTFASWAELIAYGA